VADSGVDIQGARSLTDWAASHDVDAPVNASDLDEIDHDAIGTTLPVGDGNRFAISRLHLLEQRQRIVVVDEAHRLTWMQRVERAEYRGVAEALGDRAGVERIDPVGGQMQMGVLSHGKILSLKAAPAGGAESGGRKRLKSG